MTRKALTLFEIQKRPTGRPKQKQKARLIVSGGEGRVRNARHAKGGDVTDAGIHSILF